MRDQAASTLIGGILILAILGGVILYVNAYEVPRQGASIEVAQHEEAQRALVSLAARLDGAGPISANMPLSPPKSDPPLMGGIILSPARAAGSIAVDPDGSRLSVRVVVPDPVAPAADDPIRESAGENLTRVHLIGNRTEGRALGALALESGGAYQTRSTYRLEAGAVIHAREGSSESLAAPPLRVAASDGALDLRWLVPAFEGRAAEAVGRGVATVSLSPGEVPRAGGDGAREVEIIVETNHLAAWQAALHRAVGAHGVVTTQLGATPDAGVVRAVVSAAEGGPGIRFDVRLATYEVALSGQSGG